MEKVVENGYESISLRSIREIFYNESLRWLHENNINTIGELMNADYIFSGLVIGDVRIHNNIETAYRLLRCKYLGIDPKMEILDGYGVDDIGFWLDFKNNSMNALFANRITADELKNIIKDNDEISAYKELLKIKRLGPTGAKEIVFKMSIVLDYYSKKDTAVSDGESCVKENYDLKSMYYELLELSKQVKTLDSKLDSMLDSVLEKMVSNGSMEEEKTYIKSK